MDSVIKFYRAMHLSLAIRKRDILSPVEGSMCCKFMVRQAHHVHYFQSSRVTGRKYMALKFCLKSLLISYRLLLSPFVLGLGGRCRFYPSCSAYALEAIERFPLPKALAKIARRLMSCHPFHPGGIDWVTKEGAKP